MICTRTLTIDPPGTHSLQGIDILMRCNLDIDRSSLCFPTAIQSKSATSTYTARVLETGEPQCRANLSAGWRPGSRCISWKRAITSPNIPSSSIVNSRAKSKSLRSSWSWSNSRCMGRMLVEAPEWEPIEREFVVVLLAINIFWRTADVRNSCELWIFFDWWITTGKTISKDAFEVKVNYIRWTLPFKRNGVICLPIFIAWRTWGFKIIEGWYWNLTRKRKTEKKVQFCSESSSRRSKWKLRISSPPSPLFLLFVNKVSRMKPS